MNKPLFVVLLSCLGLAGCNGDNVKQDLSSEAAAISYTLPETKVKIDAVLTLASCDRIAAKADITVIPLAVPNDPNELLEFTVSGSRMQSFWQKRDLNIDLYPNGTIKTVNAASSDKTASIIAGVIKLAASVALMNKNFVKGDQYQCKESTGKAFREYKALKGKIAEYRKEFDTSSNPKQLSEKIEALAQEIARLETGELQIKVSKTIEVKRTNSKTGDHYLDGGIIEFDLAKFDKWIEEKSDSTVIAAVNNKAAHPQTIAYKPFSLAWCAAPLNAPEGNKCMKGSPDDWDKLPTQALPTVACKTEKEVKTETGTDTVTENCPTTLVFREPVKARIIVTALSDYYGSDSDKQLVNGVIDVAQWGTLQYLDLTAGFAEDKSISLSLDEFGRKTKFGWSSNARGEGVVSGLNTIAEPITTYQTTKEGENLADMKARVNELDTRQKLNKLENCKAILDSGGFVCPDS